MIENFIIVQYLEENLLLLCLFYMGNKKLDRFFDDDENTSKNRTYHDKLIYLTHIAIKMKFTQ